MSDPAPSKEKTSKGSSNGDESTTKSKRDLFSKGRAQSTKSVRAKVTVTTEKKSFDDTVVRKSDNSTTISKLDLAPLKHHKSKSKETDSVASTDDVKSEKSEKPTTKKSKLAKDTSGGKISSGEKPVHNKESNDEDLGSSEGKEKRQSKKASLTEDIDKDIPSAKSAEKKRSRGKSNSSDVDPEDLSKAIAKQTKGKGKKGEGDDSSKQLSAPEGTPAPTEMEEATEATPALPPPPAEPVIADDAVIGIKIPTEAAAAPVPEPITPRTPRAGVDSGAAASSGTPKQSPRPVTPRQTDTSPKPVGVAASPRLSNGAPIPGSPRGAVASSPRSSSPLSRTNSRPTTPRAVVIDVPAVADELPPPPPADEEIAPPPPPADEEIAPPPPSDDEDEAPPPPADIDDLPPPPPAADDDDDDNIPPPPADDASADPTLAPGSPDPSKAKDKKTKIKTTLRRTSSGKNVVEGVRKKKLSTSSSLKVKGEKADSDSESGSGAAPLTPHSDSEEAPLASPKPVHPDFNVSAGTATPPPPPPPQGDVPTPPPPPLPGVRGRAVTKDLLLDNVARKVLTRMNVDKVDAVFKSWDHRFSNYEEVIQKDAYKNDPHKSLLYFPEGDVYVESLKPAIGQLPHVDADTQASVKDAVKFFKADYKVVRYKSRQYGGDVCIKDRVQAYRQRTIKKEHTPRKKKKKFDSLDSSNDSDGGMVASGSGNSLNVPNRGSVRNKDKGKRTPAASISFASATPEKTPTKQKHDRAGSVSGSVSPLAVKALTAGAGSPSSPRVSRDRAGSVIDEEPPFVLDNNLLVLNPEVRREARHAREGAMHGIFELINPTNIGTEPTENRSVGQPLVRVYSTRIFLHAKSVHIGAGQEDAFFFSAAFYDIEKKLRLTEDFHFDFNEANELIHSLLTSHNANPENESLARRAIVDLKYASENVYLVIRVNTVLKGNVEELAEVYTLGHVVSAKDRQKLTDTCRQAVSLLGKYQQGFAWAAVPVFGRDQKLALGDDTTIQFFRMKSNLDDDALYDIMNSDEKYKKQKSLDFTLHLSGSLFSKDKIAGKTVLDATLIRYPQYDGNAFFDEPTPSADAADTAANVAVPAAEEKKEDKTEKAEKTEKGEKGEKTEKTEKGEKGEKTEKKKKHKENHKSTDPALVLPPLKPEEVVKELETFDQEFYKPNAFARYVNNLHLYPLQISMNTSKVKAKTLMLRVYLMAADGSPAETSALKAIYGRSSAPNLANVATTTVALEEKEAIMFDEIKICLPPKLTDKHHLLFQFFTVNTKVMNPKKKEEKEKLLTEQLIGYSWVPVFKSKAVIKNNDYKVAIEAVTAQGTVPTEYLGADRKYIDEEKAYFRFRTRAVSSIYAQDECLVAYFLKVNNRRNDTEVLSSLDTLRIVHDRQLLGFFPVIMKQLFATMCESKSDAVRMKCFTSVVSLAVRVFNLTVTSGRVTHSDQLLSFISWHFDNPSKDQHVYEPFTKCWITLLSKTNGQDGATEEEKTLTEHTMRDLCWFLLEIIIKSMVMKLQANGELAHEGDRRSRFSPEFGKSLKELIRLVDVHRRRIGSGFDFMNKYYGLFMLDLARMMDRGFVFDLLYDYLTNIGNENVQAVFKLRFLHIIQDFEHYIPMNLPIDSTIDSIDTLQLKFWKNHYVAGLFINELRTLVLGGEAMKLTRSKAIATLRDLLWKHVIDERYSSEEAQSRICGIYFPVVLLAVENIGVLLKTAEKKGDEEAREWATVLLWIFANCNSTMHLRAWWTTEGEQYLLQLVSVFKFMIDSFNGPEDQPLREEAILQVLQLLDWFMDDFPEELNTENSKIYEAVAQLELHIVRSCKTENTFQAFLAQIRTFAIKFKKPLFRYLANYSMGTDLVFEVLNLCHTQTPKVITSATSILYLFLRCNSEEMGHFARMKLQSTLAISRLVKQEKCNYEELQNALEALAGFRDPANPQASWQAQVRELITRHSRIIRDCIRIAQITDAFNEHKSELLYKVSLEYVNSPELRITWLNNVATYHEKVGDIEEAAHCKVQVASLICEYLRDVMKPAVKGLPSDNAAFYRISPGLSGEKALSMIWVEGTVLSPDFSEDGLVKSLNEAVNLFIKNENYECALETLLVLMRYYLENKKYQNMTSASNLVSQYSERVFSANRTQSRIPPNFYRCGFYGEGFGEDNGKEFLYRENPTQRLADFTTALVTRYETQFGKENFELLKNKPIEELTLDPAKNYLQIINCEIFFEYDELNTRDLTYADRSFNVRRFVYETPYNPDGGKISEEVDKSWKRKYILTTAKPIPHILKRVEVIKKETKILKPIESAVDLIQTIVMRLKQALNCTPPNTKILQIILQGSILTQVNAGPIAVVKTFLGNADKYPAETIEMLKEQTRAFIRSCQFGLRFNASLIAEQPQFAPLHEAIMNSFGNLRNEAAKYVDL